MDFLTANWGLDSLGLFEDLWGSWGILEDLWESLGILGDLEGIFADLRES